jgi:enterochelin esterase family protein
MNWTIILSISVLFLLLIVWGWWAGRRRREDLTRVPVQIWEQVPSRFLAAERDIFIYLPPGFDLNAQLAPKLLLVNDGQEHEAWRLQETLALLYARKQVAPTVVAAISVGGERLQEYGTAVAPNAQNLGREAAPYARFIIEELLPMLHERLEISPSPAQTAICGASLGGLSAFDIAWNHPDLFGAVGVFSGSFWWRAAADEQAIAPGKRIAHQMVRQTADSRAFRGWFQAGTLDETSDRDNNGVIDAIQDTLELIEEIERLPLPETDIVYREVRGGRHNYETWAAVLSEFLRWAFPGGRA